MGNQKLAFFITSTGWGGLEMNTLKLAKSFIEKNYKISIISSNDSTLLEKGNDIFIDSFLIKKEKKYFDFKNAKLIANYLKEKDISVVMVFDNRDIEILSIAKKVFFKNLSIIYQQHMQMGVKKKDIFHTLRYGAIDTWISPLEHLKDEVTKLTNFPEERIKVIPLCMDINKFIYPKYSKNEARELLNINPKYPLIGIIGRITEKKGQLFLMESILKLQKENINCELLIVGSPTINDKNSMDYFEKMIEFIDENELRDIIHIRGFDSDVSLFYNSIDLFVLASESETYGMVTIEAMLSEIPIIGTNNGGTPEILNYGKFGKLFNYNDYNTLKDAINWHLENINDSRKVALNAKNDAINKYYLENEINQIDLIIKNITKK